MRIRLIVGMTLGPAGAVVECIESTALRLIARRAAEPAPEPDKKAPKKKKADKPKED